MSTCLKLERDNKGAGIGLLLVKGFVEKMMVKYGLKVKRV
jgi:hypothetical protein